MVNLKDAETQPPDKKFQYLAVASHKGKVVDSEWFVEYWSASTWCLDYTMRYEVAES